MTQIVAGIFDDERTATAAARKLRGAGFDAFDLDQFAVNPPGRHQGLTLGGDEHADQKAEGGDKAAVKGAAIGTAVGAVAGLGAAPLIEPAAVAGGAAAGAYAGSLAGAVQKMGDDTPAPTPRPAGVMVAVNAGTPEDSEVAIDVLRERGAKMIERAKGEWRGGKWADFDPVRLPDIVDLTVPGQRADAGGTTRAGSTQ
jgi:hypothetical protein